MKKFRLLFLVFTSITWQKINAQNDTANYPYWINMMQDENVNFFQTQRAFEIYWQNRKIDKGSGWKVFKRWEYSTSLRTDEHGVIKPYSDLYREIKSRDSIYKATSTGQGIGAPCRSNGDWKEVGPVKYPVNNTSQPTGMGRINSIAFHPKNKNTLYVGAPAGGLWKSEDAGLSWQSNTDSLPTLGVSAIVLDALRPDTIFIGTGDRDASDAAGLGVYWSLDGGKNWSARNNGMGNVTVGRLIQDPKNRNVLLAATNNGIFRTTDYGNNWSNRLSGNFKEIVFSAGSSQTVYASSDGKFYRSTNNGVSWSLIVSGLPGTGATRGAIAVTQADTNYVYFLVAKGSVFMGVYLSKNKGSNFTTQCTTPNLMDYSSNGSGTSGQAWYDMDLAVDPVNKNIVYVAGINIFKSVNAGATWLINAHWVGSGAPSIHADQHVLEYSPHNNYLYAGNDGGVYYQTTSDSIWYNISDGLAVSQIYKLGQSQTNKKVLVNGYQDNGTARYNGSFTTVYGGDGMDCLVDPTDESVAYGELYYGSVFRLKNNSSEGTIAANGIKGINESGAWVTPFVLKPNDPNTMFIGYKNVWRSNNVKSSTTAAVSWKRISSGLRTVNNQNINALEMNLAQPDLIYMARSDRAFFRASNASSDLPDWIDLTPSLPNNAVIQCIASDPKDSNTVYISQSNKIYRSSNRGNTWVNISANLPNAAYLSIVIDSSSKKKGMYVGGYSGVYYKDNSSANWIFYGDGLPKTSRIQDLEIYYSGETKGRSHLVAATYGRGNWVTSLYEPDRVPVADFDASDSSVCTGTVVRLQNKSIYVPTLFKWNIVPSSFRYVNGTGENSENPEILCEKAGQYTISLIVENCKGNDTIEKRFYLEIYDTARKIGCINSNVYPNWNMGISEFGLNGITHYSQYVNKEGEYIDFSCDKVFKLRPDTFYEVKILTNPTNNEYVRGFIDFNDDGDFNDPGEFVIQTKSAKSHIDTIYIPKSAVLNKPLRLRLMSDYNNFSNPCARLNYGQIQEHAVFITPAGLRIHTNKSTICRGDWVTLKDSTEKNYTNYQWNFGSGAVPQYAAGRGPHEVRFYNSGFQNILLTVDGKLSRSFNQSVFVFPKPVLKFDQKPPITGTCENNLITIEIADSNKTGFIFDWYKNNNLLSFHGNNFSIPASQLSDSGYYKVISGQNGCYDTSEVLHLLVHPAVKSGFTINQTEHCLNRNEIILKNTSGILRGNLDVRYTVDKGLVFHTKDTTFSYAKTGTYTIQQHVISDKGCQDSFVRNLQVFPSPVSVFRYNTLVSCENDQNFLFESESTLINGSIDRYIWYTNSDQNGSGAQFKPVFNKAGHYSVALVVISDKNCADTFLRTVQVKSRPRPYFEVQDSIQCLKNNLFVFSDVTTFTEDTLLKRSWNFGKGSIDSDSIVKYNFGEEGIYKISLTVETMSKCRDSVSKRIVILPQPETRFTVNDSEQCEADNQFIYTDSSVISSGSIQKFYWDAGNGIQSSSKNLNMMYSVPGNFTVMHVIESDHGCKDTGTMQVKVFEDPVAKMQIGEGCVKDTTKFMNQSTFFQSGQNKYVWSFGNGEFSNVENPSHVFLNTGQYRIKLLVSDPVNCMDSVEEQINIHAKPIADFEWQLFAAGGFNSILQLKDKSLGAEKIWWTDGLSNSFVKNAEFYYADTQRILIKLIVAGQNGCLDSAQEWIMVKPVLRVHVPDAFSPNNDGINDEFGPSGIDHLTGYELVIYNRWGERVFKSNDTSKKWDGSYLGSPLPLDTYLYFLKYRDLNNKEQISRGSIKLIR
ncbi:MAG: gliding motility-associated C-terminal domain-containing protein [Flavobacteriales bacterium]|nr:gliding motility-associated C-terminal domain-containing protein [Flavobacteriales bacterium]